MFSKQLPLWFIAMSWLNGLCCNTTAISWIALIVHNCREIHMYGWERERGRNTLRQPVCGRLSWDLTPTIPNQNPGSYSPSTYGQDQGKGENVVKAFSILCSFLTFLCHSSPSGFKQPAAERWKITIPNILVTLQLVTKCSVRNAKDDKTYGTLQIQQAAYAIPLITSHLTSCYRNSRT